MTSVISLTTTADSDGHVSCRNDDNEWCASEYYRVGGTVINPIKQEVISYSLDGTFRTNRYVHHQSDPANGGTDPYRSQPQANISRDRQFVTFNSTMGPSVNRIDVYVVFASVKSARPASGMSGAF